MGFKALRDREAASGVRPREQAPAAKPVAPPRLPRFDPATATRPTQRYLKAAGWTGPMPDLVDTGAEGVDKESLKYISPHEYRLTRWQQEQAEGDYGIPGRDKQPILLGDRYRTGKMTDTDYEALTPQQKNAVRFNEMLIAATEADRQAAVAPEEQDASYQARVSEMFGTEGGSEVYAPNTLNLLEKMNLGSQRGQDLDEYLSLDRAYDLNEIRALQPWEGTPETVPYESFGQARSQPVQQALDMRQIDLAGAVVEQALADKNYLGWNESALVSQFLGRRPGVAEIPFGWLKEGELRENEEGNIIEGFYQDWWGAFTDKQLTNLDDFWTDVERFRLTDEDLDQFFDFVYQRSKEEDRVGTADPAYRTGSEVRQFLGLGD